MSLLMEALKKAEQAKRQVTEGPVAAPPVARELELSPAESTPPQPEPKRVTETPPGIAAPPLTAAAFTLMTGRHAEINPPISLPVLAPVPQSPTVPAPAKPELSLDTSSQVTRPAPVARSLPQRRRIPVVWISVGITLLFALSGGGFWYYNSMAQYLTQQSTMGVPQTAAAPEAAVISVPPVVAPMIVSPPTIPATAQSTPRVAAKVNSVSAPVTLRPLSTNAAAAVVPAPVIAVPKEASPTGSDVIANIPVPAPISVTRDAEQNDIFATLQTAYRAYQGGDDGGAQKLYARVLARDEHNRDALLGLAAIAVRQKDFVRAQEIYSELLTLDPKDSVAQAGFVSVTGSFDPLQQEARIKALLEQEPGAPHLLFTYASFLMQQQRWLEATRSLQSALQAQRDNADYAFNLAVSFDHLGQVEAAVKHYRAALVLAAKQPTSFRVDDVRRRLQAMSPGGEGAAR